MRQRLALALMLIVALMALIGMPAPPFATANPLDQTVQTTLKVNDATKARVKGVLILNATLRTADNKPISKQSVDFYRQVDFFGPREAHLGAALTESTGIARLAYQPAEVGTERIIARFAGGGGFAKSEGDGDVQVTEAISPYVPAELPLAQVRQWLPLVVGGLVLTTWVVMIGLLGTTVRRVSAAGREPRAG